MTHWRSRQKIWCSWPAKPTRIIEFLGGSYLSTSPHISYRYLLEYLSGMDYAIHAWTYLPSFDHQFQANEAWKAFRECKKDLESRISYPIEVIRVGHSLGSKLHLLSPDNGRGCVASVSISFNNFNAKESIPLLGKISTKLKFQTEFSPSPKETLMHICGNYCQLNNLVINFSNDKIDQSKDLINSLVYRNGDNSKTMELSGDHLSPVSSGIRKKLNYQTPKKYKTIESIAKSIDNYNKSLIPS